MNKFYMVKGRGPTNVHHATRELAEAEATRLAKLNRGTRYVVLEACRSFRVPPVDNVEIVDLDEPQKSTGLWYPDDSGEWVEHDGGPCPVSKYALVSVLLAHERDAKRHSKMTYPAFYWTWNLDSDIRIVAYKVFE
ncbi:hypothetical protein ATO13_23316 [Stappia sp. 22II-S9-Z10]|nr:hypothetical protein ATO13_23316 [Stappia sp. 22II-S9-Z10]